MNHSQAAWEASNGPLLSLRAPCLPLFAPDNTVGIVPRPPFILISSPGTIQLFRAGPHTHAFMAAGLIKNILTPPLANNVHHQWLQHQSPAPKWATCNCWCMTERFLISSFPLWLWLLPHCSFLSGSDLRSSQKCLTPFFNSLFFFKKMCVLYFQQGLFKSFFFV